MCQDMHGHSAHKCFVFVVMVAQWIYSDVKNAILIDAHHLYRMSPQYPSYSRECSTQQSSVQIPIA